MSAPETRLWDRVRNRPDYAAELLALAAVAELGGQARDWAAEIRATYPAASRDGLVRLATQRCTRLAAAAGVAAATTGLAGGVAELAGLAWAQARLVLQVAAAYEQDPTDPARAVDLLVLTQVHPTPEAARDAIQAATHRESQENQESQEEGTHEESREQAQRLVALVSARTKGWGLRRLAARLLPGAGLLLAVASSTASTERLAARAITHYRTAAKAS